MGADLKGSRTTRVQKYPYMLKALDRSADDKIPGATVVGILMSSVTTGPPRVIPLPHPKACERGRFVASLVVNGFMP